tara:strand:- start:187 stop:513 length:327 start_codon:yes stop_codon:yes gene_type:complete
MEKSIPDECSSDRLVVNKPHFLQAVETDVDTCGTKSLLPEASFQLCPGAGAVRDEIEGGVADSNILIVVDQLVLSVGRKVIPDAEATSLERFERDLEGFATIEVDPDL